MDKNHKDPDTIDLHAPRLRRSAKYAYQTGVKASSIAHAGISFKKSWPTEASLNIQWT